MQNLIFTQKKQSPMLISAIKHFKSTIKYMSVRKAVNIFIVIIEMLLKRTVLISHFCYLRIEVSPYCNLTCTGCLLGGANILESNPEHRKGKIMSFELFKNSVQDFLPFLLKVNLYDEGEPLLNKKIPEMINHLSINKVATCVSSNFSLKLSEEYLRQLLSCGLDHLIVAVDGASQETYSKYRNGGDLTRLWPFSWRPRALS